MAHQPATTASAPVPAPIPAHSLPSLLLSLPPLFQGDSERGSLKVSGTIKSMADDLAAFLATLPAPAVLVGHSFGGIVVERWVCCGGWVWLWNDGLGVVVVVVVCVVGVGRLGMRTVSVVQGEVAVKRAG